MNNGRFIAIFFISGFISPIMGEIKPINYDLDALLAPCVLKLCEKYFKSNRSLSGSLVIINLVPKPSVVQARILKSLNEDEDHAIAVMVKDSKKPHLASRVQEKAQNYFMLLQHFDEFDQTLKQIMELPTWNPLAQFVVQFTFPFPDKRTQGDWTLRLFTELLAVDVLKVNALYQFTNDTERIRVVTWFPYHNVSCPTRIDNIREIEECHVSYNDSVPGEVHKEYPVLSFNQEYYPIIPTKLHRCNIHVSAIVWEPFVVATGDELGEEYLPVIDKGLEVVMLKTIAQGLDLHLNVHPYRGEKRARNITNDAKYGLYADLKKKRSDVMIGGLFENRISREVASSSIPYYQDDITWCVAKAGLAPKWLNVFIIFNYKTWLALIGTLFITSAFLFTFVRMEGKYRENYMWAFLIMFSVSTAQNAHYKPLRIGIKIFLASFFFFGLHISTAYHSYLINVLTNPRYSSQIESIADAINRNMTFSASENAWEFFQKNDSISKYLAKHYVTCKKLDDCFLEAVKDETKAVAISRSHAQNNPLQLRDSVDFSCFPTQENVVIYSVVMMFRRFYHLLPMIDGKIRTIAEAGLLTKWELDSLKRTKKDDTSGGGGHGSRQIKLSVQHVEGAFILIMIGLFASLVVFGLEHLVFWFSRKKANWKIVKNFEEYICHSK